METLKLCSVAKRPLDVLQMRETWNLHFLELRFDGVHSADLFPVDSRDFLFVFHDGGHDSAENRQQERKRERRAALDGRDHGLSHEHREIGAGEAAREQRELVEQRLDLLNGVERLEIEREDLFSLGLRGREDGNLLVEASCAAERVVEREGARCGGENEHAMAHAKPVDAGEQLRDELRVLLVVFRALAAETVDVFDPDDRKIAIRRIREATRRCEDAVHLAGTAAVVGVFQGEQSELLCENVEVGLAEGDGAVDLEWSGKRGRTMLVLPRPWSPVRRMPL